MTNRDFGRGLASKLQTILGIKAVNIRTEISSKPDVLKALEKIARAYAEEYVKTLPLNPDIVAMDAKVKFYIQLAEETKKKNKKLMENIEELEEARKQFEAAALKYKKENESLKAAQGALLRYALQEKEVSWADKLYYGALGAFVVTCLFVIKAMIMNGGN